MINKNEVCFACKHPRRLHFAGYSMKFCRGNARGAGCSCVGFTIRDLAIKKVNKKLKVKAMVEEMAAKK